MTGENLEGISNPEGGEIDYIKEVMNLHGFPNIIPGAVLDEEDAKIIYEAAMECYKEGDKIVKEMNIRQNG